MKKNRIVMFLLGIVTLVMIVGINTSFEKISARENSFTLSQLEVFTTAIAENPPSGYKPCAAGDLTMDGIPVLWCGDCNAHWVWPKYNGDCRIW